MHVTAALTAAIAIRDQFRVAAIGLASHVPGGLSITAGLWSGHVLAGSLGTKSLRSVGTLGCELNRAVALQQYAAAVSLPIIVNAGIWTATCDAPQHRLLPVDVVDFTETNPSSRGPSHTEVVFECISCLAPAEDEWMYQLMDVQAENQVERQLHDIFSQLQRGVYDTDQVSRYRAG